jgi:hypothetical protein
MPTHDNRYPKGTPVGATPPSAPEEATSGDFTPPPGAEPCGTDVIDPYLITLFDEESGHGLAFMSFTPSLVSDPVRRGGFSAWLRYVAECLDRGEDPRLAARNRKMSSGGWIKG